jgi:hypothetical protein
MLWRCLRLEQTTFPSLFKFLSFTDSCGTPPNEYEDNSRLTNTLLSLQRIKEASM